MKKQQLNDKQKLLLYKFGYYSFFIFLIEIGIVVLIYAGIEPSDGMYNLLHSIKTTELLFALTVLPIGYYTIRVKLSDCEYERHNVYLAPFIAIPLLSNSKGIIFKIPSLIIICILFIVSIYQLIKNKKSIN